MNEYDVVVIGGAVAGPTAAKFTSRNGLKTLLVEQYKIPRNKACSGIQFPYFEKIIGDKIPRERLCNNDLNKIEMVFPNGKKISAPTTMLNFMRDTFDEWLCRLAEESGAEFRDGCKFKDFHETADGIIVDLETEMGPESVKTRYLIDASGLRPAIRKKLLKEEAYKKGSSGATINYYFTADGDLDPNTLYQYWNIEYNNMMFAWVYNKTLSDGKDYWVVGTGYDTGIKERQELFFNHIINEFNLVNINIIKKEGYSSSLIFDDKERIRLGRDNILLCGDAAGLVDLTRGVGMDAAALSGRLAAKAIIQAEKSGRPVMEHYSRLMKYLVKQTVKNQKKGINCFRTNEELQKHLSGGMIKMSINMIGQNILNKLRSPERQVMIP